MDVQKDIEEQSELNGVLPNPIRRRLRRWLSAKQLYECLRPLFRLTFLHGLTSFYIGYEDGNGVRDIKKSWCGYVNGVFHIGFYGMCYIFTIYNNCESVASYFFRSNVTYFGDMLQIVSGFIGVTVIYLTAIIPKHRLEQCLQKFHTMDAQLQSVGVKIMYSKVLRFSYAEILIMGLVISLFTWGTFVILYAAHVSPSWALHFTFMVQHTVVALAIAMFTCFTYLVEIRFAMVHKAMGMSEL